MLNTAVLAFGVLPDKDGVHIVVWGLVASNALAWSYVGEEVECAAQSEIERDVALANRCSKRAFERDVIAGDGLDSFIGNDGLAVLDSRGDIYRLPLYRNVGGGEDVFDGLRDLGPGKGLSVEPHGWKLTSRYPMPSPSINVTQYLP